MVSSKALCCAALVALASLGGARAADGEFSYEANGLDWDEVAEMCGTGMEQSPIDVKTSIAVDAGTHTSGRGLTTFSEGDVTKIAQTLTQLVNVAGGGRKQVAQQITVAASNAVVAKHSADDAAPPLENSRPLGGRRATKEPLAQDGAMKPPHPPCPWPLPWPWAQMYPRPLRHEQESFLHDLCDVL